MTTSGTPPRLPRRPKRKVLDRRLGGRRANSWELVIRWTAKLEMDRSWWFRFVKMPEAELSLAFRFSCMVRVDLMDVYLTQPVLLKILWQRFWVDAIFPSMVRQPRCTAIQSYSLGPRIRFHASKMDWWAHRTSHLVRLSGMAQ